MGRERLIVFLECQKLLISIRFPFAGKLKLIRAIHQRNLLWRNFESLCPHVNFLVNIHTGNDEEHSGPPGTASQQPAQAEDHSPLIFLKNEILQGKGQFIILIRCGNRGIKCILVLRKGHYIYKCTRLLRNISGIDG